MYWDAQLVHGDLSAYNILYWHGTAWIIDVSQAVLTTHPNAATFLLRDCRNLVRFFADAGVSDVLSPLELFVAATAEPGPLSLVVEVAVDDASDVDVDEALTGRDTGSNTASSATGDDRASQSAASEEPFPQRDLLDYARLPEFIARVRADVAVATAAHPDVATDPEALMTHVFHPRRPWRHDSSDAAPRATA